jgi:predicted secreted Zn-dependent protease
VLLAAAQCAAGDLRVQPPESESPALAKFGPWVEFFDIEGNEYEALLRSLNRRGPHGAHGMAIWSISYSYLPVGGKGGCTVSKFEAKLEARILMPRWTRRDGASADLIARWQRYEAGLIAHEEGHLDNGRALVRALNREMQTFPPTKSCKDIYKAVDAYFDQREQVYRKLDEQYDERTDHGRKLGIPAL